MYSVEMANAQVSYGVMEFTAKARIQGNGILFWPQFEHGGQKGVVRCNKQKQTNMWAKVKGDELVELLGDVGKYSVESNVLRVKYGVTPCKYPSTTPTQHPSSEVVLYESGSSAIEGAYTVDGPSTKDRDDAITYEEKGDGTFTIGVHICDVTRRIDETLYCWAMQRGASAYWHDDTGDPCCKPMLPPELAHSCLSLDVSSTYHPCISMFMTFDHEGAHIESTHAYTRVRVVRNATYEEFKTDPVYDMCRSRLKKLSCRDEAEELIAWCMMQYNLYFARMLKPGMLLRVQANTDAIAKYALVPPSAMDSNVGGDMCLQHAGIQGLYGHFTSPIRRFADMHNQFVIKSMSLVNPNGPLRGVDVTALNDRMQQLQQFHYYDTIMMLAYRYKLQPAVVNAAIDVTEDGRCMLVHLAERRVRIPLHDNFYAEPIHQMLATSLPGTLHRIELFGIQNKKGRAELRLRFVRAPPDRELMAPASEDASPISENNDTETQTPVADRPAFKTPPIDQESSDEEPVYDIVPPPNPACLDTVNDAASRLQVLLGYPLDEFQMNALRVIQNGNDLLGMAPTGSGKTVLALMAIVLKAFDVKGRAILTSPIKALSNQKYAEFTNWLKRITPGRNRVTLLTGDIHARATPPGGDGESELLIMTSEILANKLDATRRSGKLDQDLENVKVVIMDEVHYINDAERGHVWEQSIMSLPSHVSIVALSATLSAPDSFCQWMSTRRPTVVVQRHDRHVPLYVGGYANDRFTELYSTHASPRVFQTSNYDALFKNKKRIATNFQQSVGQLVDVLEKDDKLPAIVFMMSRAKCVQAAACLSKNLLCGYRPKKQKNQDDYEFAYLLEEHQYKVQQIRRRQTQLFSKYLAPFKRILEILPGFSEFQDMLDKGIAYHHAGMLPLLREFVEILFQQKLLKVVFATETLGVGINMPARTVVFTEVEKPTGEEDGGRRLLRSDEFWQMAGRSGRRGMDDKGYVVYHPLNGNPSTALELRQLLTGTMPCVTSKLKINPLFVLKHNRESSSILAKTLLQYELDKRTISLERAVNAMEALDVSVEEDARSYVELNKQLRQQTGFIKLTPLQRKKYEKEMQSLSQKYSQSSIEHAVSVLQEKLKAESDLHECRHAAQHDWQTSYHWLHENGFVDSENGMLTHKGMITAHLSDGEPLIRGHIIANNHLDDLPFEVIVGWLASFCESIHVKRDHTSSGETTLSSVDSRLDDIFALSERVADGMGLRDTPLNWESAVMMYTWASSKDIVQISRVVDTANLGVFVRTVLRVISFIDEIKTVLLGTEKYALYNKLENHHERLLSGVVTNQSLYV
jgi:superfamily II RNA helicase